jgi:helicase
LSFESSLRLIELMRHLNVAQADPVQVLAIVQVLAEMDGIYTPVMKRGQSESVRPSQAAQRFGHATAQGLQRYCQDQFEFWARCKRASILFDWIAGTSIDDLGRSYSTTPFQGAISYGDIIRIADGARFHLRSAHQVLSALFPDQPVFLTALDELLRRLEFGLPAAALGLTDLSAALSRGQYLALLAAGAGTAAAAKALDRDTLTRSVGAVAAAAIRGKQDAPEGIAAATTE